MTLKRVGLLGGLGLLLLGCAGEQPTQAHGAETDESTAIDGVVTAYEAVRSQLANDQTTGLSAAFDRLQVAALAASEKDMPEVVTEHLAKVGVAAAKGAKAEYGNLEEGRRAFGEASEHLVAAVASEPSLAHGLSIFECPMTEGYPKWVQASDPKANPYTGKEMQSCGVESQWE